MMKQQKTIPISSLPSSITETQALELCYRDQLDLIIQRLIAHYRVLIRCDKGLNAYLFPILRKRLKNSGEELKLVLIDGCEGSTQDDQGAGSLTPMSRTQRTLFQISSFMRGGLSSSEIAFITHLDMVGATHSALTPELRELIPLLYEHPRARFCAFVDPSFSLPQPLTDAFDLHVELGGVSRAALGQLITQREARSLHHQSFDPYTLYPFLSGLNALKARRLLSTLKLRPEATPLSDRSAQNSLRALREQTAEESDGFELPNIDLHHDIAGYDILKDRLQRELIDLALSSKRLDRPEEIELAESLTPRGILFYGPPGTGKTYFAKAIATSLQATLTVVSGPELKSKWVGESEENLRRVFRRARAASPSVIVFDELDSFAQTRGGYDGTGVEHSMVNQLLTEMDGFRSNEQVFVVGTTNFLRSVDPALLRPGRFELLIEVPAPDLHTREKIIAHYQEVLNLKLSEPLQKWIAEQTDRPADKQGNPYTADHLKSLCRSLKRELILGKSDVLNERVILEAMSRDEPAISLTTAERELIARHECGHALLSYLSPLTKCPSRISIRPDPLSLGRVQQRQLKSRYTYTKSDFEAEIRVLLAGLCAEELRYGEHSVGAAQDLSQATNILREMITHFGMSPLGLTSFASVGEVQRHADEKSRSESYLASSELWITETLTNLKEEVSSTLKRHEGSLDALTVSLLERDELTESEIHELLSSLIL